MISAEQQEIFVIIMLCSSISFVLGSFLIDIKKYDYDTRKGTILCEGTKSIIVWNTKTYCLKENEE